jgi:sigma-B regulation protein RsbQ
MIAQQTFIGGEMPQSADDIVRRHDVRVSGDPAGRAIVFAHGFGGDQHAWRHVVPEFRADHRVVLFDLMGAGQSDTSAYDRVRYDSLHGYADDLVAILDALELRDVVYVGHCVSGMIGVLAAARRPELFGDLVLVAASPRYIDADGYVGGFTREAVDDLLASLEANPVRSHEALAPLFGDPMVLRDTDPEIALQLARVMFLSDTRRDLADVTTPTLILQPAGDRIVPIEVGDHLREHLPAGRLVRMRARGHQVNLTAPDEIAQAIRDHLAGLADRVG